MRDYVDVGISIVTVGSCVRYQTNTVISKAQLEYKLKSWGFRRNIDRETWVSIDHTIAKRKRMGKDSEVIFSGKRLKQSTVERETNRHRDRTIFAQVAPR